MATEIAPKSLALARPEGLLHRPPPPNSVRWVAARSSRYALIADFKPTARYWIATDISSPCPRRVSPVRGLRLPTGRSRNKRMLLKAERVLTASLRSATSSHLARLRDLDHCLGDKHKGVGELFNRVTQ